MNWKKRFRVNRKPLYNWAVWLAAILLSAILIFSVFSLLRIAKGYSDSRQTYSALANSVVATVSPAPSASPQTETTSAPPEVPLTIDWDSLRRTNADVVAWLYCAGTPVNYPVVQAENNEYYLTRNVEREKSDGGALFLDCRNNILAQDENFIVYGHRMKDDSMFGTLPQYAEADYYTLHPIMYLLTPEQNYRVDLFACRTVHSEEKYFETSFPNKTAFQRYLSKAVEQSYWQPDFEPGTGHPSITLVTCSTYENADNPRFLLHGILVPIG